jgi:hypothetical protein
MTTITLQGEFKMNLQQILAFLAPFEPLLKSELLNLEGQGLSELNDIISKVSSPDLQALLQALASAIDSFSKLEINKLP